MLSGCDVRFRTVFGEEVHFVGLTLDETECMNRIRARHDDQPEILEKIKVDNIWTCHIFSNHQHSQIFVKMFDIGEDKEEPNMAVLRIDPKKTPDEVVEEIVKLTKQE